MMEQNPIDKDKVAENPGLLPYAHTVGGAVIKPMDKGRTKGLAVEAMRQQTNMQLEQIKKQMELLADQARKLGDRIQISQSIYGADINFKPLIGHLYHLYDRKDGVRVLSMIGPREWGRSFPFEAFVASVQLLADHTWDIIETA